MAYGKLDLHANLRLWPHLQNVSYVRFHQRQGLEAELWSCDPYSTSNPSFRPQSMQEAGVEEAGVRPALSPLLSFPVIRTGGIVTTASTPLNRRTDWTVVSPLSNQASLTGKVRDRLHWRLHNSSGNNRCHGSGLLKISIYNRRHLEHFFLNGNFLSHVFVRHIHICPILGALMLLF